MFSAENELFCTSHTRPELHLPPQALLFAVNKGTPQARCYAWATLRERGHCLAGGELYRHQGSGLKGHPETSGRLGQVPPGHRAGWSGRPQGLATSDFHSVAATSRQLWSAVGSAQASSAPFTWLPRGQIRSTNSAYNISWSATHWADLRVVRFVRLDRLTTNSQTSPNTKAAQLPKSPTGHLQDWRHSRGYAWFFTGCWRRDDQV